MISLRCELTRKCWVLVISTRLSEWNRMSILDPEARRALMARFRGKDTKPEIQVRRALHAAGRRFRLHQKHLPGKPDVVLPRDRTVVFVHGCFWHAHEGCAVAHVPKSRPDYWQAKFDNNRERDRRNTEKLEHLGWRVITIWECEARSPHLITTIERLGLVAKLSGVAPPRTYGGPSLHTRSDQRLADVETDHLK